MLPSLTGPGREDARGPAGHRRHGECDATGRTEAWEPAGPRARRRVETTCAPCHGTGYVPTAAKDGAR